MQQKCAPRHLPLREIGRCISISGDYRLHRCRLKCRVLIETMPWPHKQLDTWVLIFSLYVLLRSQWLGIDSLAWFQFPYPAYNSRRGDAAAHVAKTLNSQSTQSLTYLWISLIVIRFVSLSSTIVHSFKLKITIQHSTIRYEHVCKRPTTCRTNLHIHTHIHTRMHIYTYAYKHAYIHTYKHAKTCTHTYMHTYLYSCIHTYVHICIHAYIHNIDNIHTPISHNWRTWFIASTTSYPSLT